MGSVKKALKPITRVVDNIIPNEIKPALPFIAASFGAPYLAGKGILGALGTKALGQGVSAGLINLGTQAALGQRINPTSIAASGLMAGGGAFLSRPGASKFSKEIGKFLAPGKVGDMGIGEAIKAASAPATAGAIQATQDAAIEANNAYEAYLKEQQDAENEDIMTRVDFITRYLKNAGFDQSTIDERLNELGYAANGGLMGTRVDLANGGRVGLALGGMDPRGGKPTGDPILDSLIEESIDEETPPKGIMAAMDMFRKPNTGRVAQLFQQIEDGVNVSEAMAELFNVYDIDLYPKNAEGGVMNLKMDGMPAEMDLRKGGFVPIGAK